MVPRFADVCFDKRRQDVHLSEKRGRNELAEIPTLWAERADNPLFRSDEGTTTLIINLEPSDQTVQVIFLPMNVCLTLD